jgi:hypothetical protein
MPLQHLVEYFNDRLGREHRSSFRPFVLEEGKVSGLFGPIRINSFFCAATADVDAYCDCRSYGADYRCPQ